MSKRVLVVDDEIDTLKLLKTILEISGYEAYTTLNSLEALTLAQVEQPDVVLLDIMMPKLDGFQLCKMMRAHPSTQLLPIIFVTAYDALDLEDRRKSSGGDMVLPKPINMDALIKAIEVVESLERNIPDDIKQASQGISSTNGKNGGSATPPTPAKVEEKPAEVKTVVEPPKAEAPKTDGTGAVKSETTPNGASAANSEPMKPTEPPK